jgi:hypothetical protein
MQIFFLSAHLENAELVPERASEHTEAVRPHGK